MTAATLAAPLRPVSALVERLRAMFRNGLQRLADHNARTGQIEPFGL